MSILFNHRSVQTAGAFPDVAEVFWKDPDPWKGMDMEASPMRQKDGEAQSGFGFSLVETKLKRVLSQLTFQKFRCRAGDKTPKDRRGFPCGLIRAHSKTTYAHLIESSCGIIPSAGQFEPGNQLQKTHLPQ